MKKILNSFVAVILVLSLFFNFFLLHRQTESRSNTFFRYGSEEHSIDIYVEKESDDEKIRANLEQPWLSIGDVEIIELKDGLFLFTDDHQINLTELGTKACIVKTNGEVLYHFEEYEESESVFVTPSGKKYHYDPSCAGKNAFQAPLEAAALFREPCSICA